MYACMVGSVVTLSSCFSSPPTRAIAEACDAVFPERRGWFLDWYTESRTWSEVPPGFRSWSEYEDSALSLRVSSPGIIHGLLQTEDYARALLATWPGVTGDVLSARLANRMERQRRVILRDPDPPASLFLVDELSLYRLVGSPEIMAAQMRHVSSVAATPHVTMQVLPAIAHPATASELILTEDAAYAEHMAGGLVYTGDTVSSLASRFDTLRSESYRASESAALIDRMGELWATGASPLSATLAAGPA